MASSDSESEDQPRAVLDLGGFFTIHDRKPPIIESLEEIRSMLTQIPGIGVVRPVRSLGSIAHAINLMSVAWNLGVWKGTIFKVQAGLSPDDIFSARSINHLNGHKVANSKRFCIRRKFVPGLGDLKSMAIYTDGACVSNGLGGARGGFAFSFNTDHITARPLELKGPTGEVYPLTSQRAELRAVVAALRFRVWWGEGWNRIVIITESDYVACGATIWMQSWAARGWRTSIGRPVANQDLWEDLSQVMGECAEHGCEISFWMIPRGSNTRVTAAASTACNLEPQTDFCAEVDKSP